MIKTFFAWPELHDGQLTFTNEGEPVEVTQETISVIKQNGKIINKFITERIYYEMLMQNFQDVLKVIDKFNTAEVNFTRNTDFIPYLNNLNRLLVNALVSVHTYLDYYEKTINTNADVKKLTAMYFDESALYRFIYKLRNFVVHKSLPITRLQSDIETTPSTQFYISTEYLLSSESFKWGKAKEYIINAGKLISVLDLVKDTIILFTSFHLKLVSDSIDKIIEIQKFYDSFARFSESTYSYPFILYVDTDDMSKISWSDLFTINVEKIDNAMKLLKIDPHTGMRY